MARSRSKHGAGFLAESAGPSFSPAGEEPHYLGHRDRLREKFVESGGDALPDYELLELVLFRSIPRRDVKPLAKALIRRFGSFAEVVGAERARLLEVEGIGPGVVTDLNWSKPPAGASHGAKSAIATC